MPADSDSDAIHAVLRGEVERYAELVQRHQAATLRLAFSLVGNYEDAKEVSQNGFVKAYRHLRRFRGRAKFSTWLYRIVANECKDFCRRRSRKPQAIPFAADPDDDGPVGLFEVADPAANPREELDSREFHRRLSDAMAELSMKQRTAFVLHHLHGLPVEEAAAIMGCRVGTIKSHLFRAAEQLRARLQPFVAPEEGLR